MKFTKEDFVVELPRCVSGSFTATQQAHQEIYEKAEYFANLANAKLAKWLSAAPIISSNGFDEENLMMGTHIHSYEKDSTYDCSYKARLVCIVPIQEKE